MNEELYCLEIGCGNEPTRKKGENILHTDLVKTKFVSQLLDADKKFPFPDNTFDKVYAFGVLEHVQDFYFTVNEIHRVLKPNGLLVCCLPHFASSINYWEASHRLVGHSRIFHSWTEFSEGCEKSMRETNSFRKFEIAKFDYTINFGKILKPIINFIGFKNYEYWLARTTLFNIDMIFFELKKVE